MNYLQIYQAVQDYSENTESLFLQNIPTFVQQAEERIYNSVQLPALRRNVTGSLTASNKYLAAPSDFLSVYSLAVIDADGNYNYLLNKDVNFIRAAYPKPTSTGYPQYYGLFGSQSSTPNELAFIVGPTPDASYQAELHYFYYPISIVQGIATTLTITNAGTGYTNGTYENVALSGGSGTGLLATVIVSGGIISSVAIINGGSLYVVNDVLSTSATVIGNTGAGFTVTVTAINNATGTSWLGDNYDPALLYGAMREAMLFMKGEQDLVTYYEQKYQEALAQLKRLGDGLERGDAYRDGQTKIAVNT
jgi:hypothetical protein